ncbi:gliding motility protein GldL [Kaistella sp. G5-32]|uniref:Gliding motility protein GldL n=1 Tax=Kaistella gelatinilytica TaxID=2787636 RepID=A0ABS0FDG6_9FLAO|nr:gliding motility protein GldL [Kaistella gelatinilytica]MBF8457703.1 gliding motility protein GldL [Kaistella gelatinilytica]
MKKIHIVLIFALGLILNLIGALFKITHWENGNILLAVGLSLQLIAVVLFLYKLFTSPRFKN